MSPFEYRRIVKALETFGGGFFQSFATCLQKADPINKVILLEAFRKMNKADLYLPGGVHYEDEESTPSFKMSELQKCQDQSKMWAEENLGIKL
jgi:hypothetical protein